MKSERSLVCHHDASLYCWCSLGVWTTLIERREGRTYFLESYWAAHQLFCHHHYQLLIHDIYNCTQWQHSWFQIMIASIGWHGDYNIILIQQLYPKGDLHSAKGVTHLGSCTRLSFYQVIYQNCQWPMINEGTALSNPILLLPYTNITVLEHDSTFWETLDWQQFPYESKKMPPWMHWTSSIVSPMHFVYMWNSHSFRSLLCKHLVYVVSLFPSLVKI